MKDPNKIRFIAANYATLQGLRIVPLGVFVLLAALLSNYLWAHGLALVPLWQRGVVEFAKYSAILGVLMVSMTVSLVLIEKYYFRNFGKVHRTPESRRFEWLIQILGSILLVGAFWADITYRWPVSCMGLVFSAAMIAEYLRLTWLVGGRYLVYYPIGASIIALVSILPLFGFSEWWLGLGLENELVGIEMMVGVFCVLAGIWGHLFLLSALSPRREADNVHAV
jgi:hypothetical protein